MWPPILRYFIHIFSWRGGILLYSSLFLHNMVFAFLLRPIPVVPNDPDPGNSQSLELINKNRSALANTTDTPGSQSCLKRTYNFLDKVLGLSTIASWRFLLFTVYRGCTTAAFYGLIFYSVRRVTFLGIDPLTASITLSVFSIASTLGRLAGGAIGNLQCTNQQILCVVSSTMGGSLLMCSGFIPKTFGHNAAYYGALGLFIGKHFFFLNTL